MTTSCKSLLAAAACFALGATPCTAQTTPMPSPQATLAPSPASTLAPTTRPSTSEPSTGSQNIRAKGKIKKLRAGNLSTGQIAYALTHLSTEIRSLRKLHKVRFANLRVQRVPASLRGLIRRAQSGRTMLAYEPVSLGNLLAQTPAPTSGGLLGSLVNLIANINISDALNNALNGNTVAVSLTDVLNGNNIAIGQVIGIYIGSGGIITTLIK